MDAIGQIFAQGSWFVKPGNEEAFIAAWEELAKWTVETQSGFGKPHLLQDLEEPQRFISFGPWDDVASIQAWRQRPEFQSYLSKSRELCEDIQPPRTMKLVATAAVAIR